MEKNERYKDVVTYLIRKGLASTQGQIAHLLDYKNASHFSQVMKGIKPISEQKLGNVKKIAPEINVRWIIDGEGQMLISDTVQALKEDDYQWVEFVDLETSAGNIGVEKPAILPEHKRMLLPKEREAGKYLVIKVVGRSMEDGIYSIHEGSHILIKEVTDLKLRTEVLKLIDNLYVIVTKEGTVLKQIIEQNQEKGYIVCHSYNKDFKDYKIYFEDIPQIFIYIKVVSAKPPIPNIYN